MLKMLLNLEFLVGGGLFGGVCKIFPPSLVCFGFLPPHLRSSLLPEVGLRRALAVLLFPNVAVSIPPGRHLDLETFSAFYPFTDAAVIFFPRVPTWPTRFSPYAHRLRGPSAQLIAV